MPKPDQPITGGCLCGALHYAVRGPALQTAHCHCTMCRRASGALVVTFTVVRRADFHWTQGQPTVYASSAHAERHFCGRCGSQIAFWDRERPEDLDLNTGCLDHPDQYPATKHVWSDTRIPWMHVDPELPG